MGESESSSAIRSKERGELENGSGKVARRGTTDEVSKIRRTGYVYVFEQTAYMEGIESVTATDSWQHSAGGARLSLGCKTVTRLAGYHCRRWLRRGKVCARVSIVEGCAHPPLIMDDLC